MEDWSKVASDLLQQAAGTQVWYCKGPLGAGKTTLIQAICNHLGVQRRVTSPTFSLVHEYLTQNQKRIYHFDLYRLNDPKEAIAIGLEDYLEQGDYLFIEWPEVLTGLGMPTHFQIAIEPVSPSKRILTSLHRRGVG